MKHPIPTNEEWDKMEWSEKVASRVNNHHDRLEILEDKLDQLLNGEITPKVKTVARLLGNVVENES